MTLNLATFNIRDPRPADKRLRIAVVRHLPRGVPKRQWQFDTWLPLLAPSAELLAAFKHAEISDVQFFRKYRSEMKQPDPRHVIELLATVAAQTPLAIGCHCDDPSRCHRTALSELIRKSATA